MNKLWILLLTLLNSPLLYGKILNYKISPGHIVQVPLAKACQLMGVREKLLLVEVVKQKLDCMGKKFPLTAVCKNRRPETFPIDLIRAKYNPTSEMVICNFSDQVLFSLECNSKDSWQCEDPKVQCLRIRPKVAYELSLIRSHAIKNDNETTVLSCLFQSEIDMSLKEESDKNFEIFLKSL